MADASRRDARRRRRIPAAIAAHRASISRGVAIGSYTTVLFVMGMAERLADLADPRNDSTGLQLEEERLPQRIRIGRKDKGAKQ